MKQLDDFTNSLKQTFGKRLKSIFIYGAKSDIDLEELDADINLMVITDTLLGEDLKSISKASKKWMKNGIFRQKNPEPVFMGEHEWLNSSDVYAIEYSDIKENHKIIYGDDLICQINVRKDDLRLQCERETKNLLMRFRSHYLLNAESPHRMKHSITPVIKSSIAIFKSILRLKDIEVPKSKYEIIKRINEITSIDNNLFEKLLCSKDKYCNMPKKEVYDTADKIVYELTKLLEYINNL